MSKHHFDKLIDSQLLQNPPSFFKLKTKNEMLSSWFNEQRGGVEPIIVAISARFSLVLCLDLFIFHFVPPIGITSSHNKKIDPAVDTCFINWLIVASLPSNWDRAGFWFSREIVVDQAIVEGRKGGELVAAMSEGSMAGRDVIICCDENQVIRQDWHTKHNR